MYKAIFLVVTDHESLKWIKEAQRPARLVRWSLTLSTQILLKYDSSIIWKKGKNNQNADALSRLTSPEASIQSESRLEQVFNISKYVEDIFTDETIINCQQNDPIFQDIIKNCNLNQNNTPCGSFVNYIN